MNHIMIRGIRHKATFGDQDDQRDFVTRLGKLSNQTGENHCLVFIAELIMHIAEAEQRVKRFIPLRERAVQVAGVIEEICWKEK